METEGLSDDDINSVPDISGLNFDHLNLSSRQPVRSAVTINEHLPQDMPTLDDILHLPQSSGEPISLANPGLPLLSLFGSRMENGQPHELSQHLNLQACNRSGIFMPFWGASDSVPVNTADMEGANGRRPDRCTLSAD